MYINRMKYWSVIEWNKLPGYAKTSIDFISIVLIERNQTQTTYYMIPFIIPFHGKTTRTENRSVVGKGREGDNYKWAVEWSYLE